MAELLLGCGSNKAKKVGLTNNKNWTDLTTLDMNSDHNPDFVHDLTEFPYPFEDNSFDEIHAYDVLEHTGQQGDWRFFFDQWSELWRILKPDGLMVGISPHMSSVWAWGDPGHTRIISTQSFVFLSQQAYKDQVGKTAMTDYRFYYKADFDVLQSTKTNEGQLIYVLKAVKPPCV